MVKIPILQRAIFGELVCCTGADFINVSNALKMMDSLFHESKELGEMWPCEGIEATVDGDFSSLEDFLDDPRTLPVLPLSQVQNCSKRDCMIVVDRQVREERFSLNTDVRRDEIYGQFTTFFLGSKPNNHLVCKLIYFAHDRNLLAAFSNVILVDADSIYPQSARCFW